MDQNTNSRETGILSLAEMIGSRFNTVVGRPYASYC